MGVSVEIKITECRITGVVFSYKGGILSSIPVIVSGSSAGPIYKAVRRALVDMGLLYNTGFNDFIDTSVWSEIGKESTTENVRTLREKVLNMLKCCFEAKSAAEQGFVAESVTFFVEQ